MAKTPDSKKFMGLLGQYQFFVIFYAKNWRKSRNTVQSVYPSHAWAVAGPHGQLASDIYSINFFHRKTFFPTDRPKFFS